MTEERKAGGASGAGGRNIEDDLSGPGGAKSWNQGAYSPRTDYCIRRDQEICNGVDGSERKRCRRVAMHRRELGVMAPPKAARREVTWTRMIR